MAGKTARQRLPRLPSETASEEVRSLGGRDYTRPLLKALSRAEVREILSEARRKVWPRLNREPVRLVSPRDSPDNGPGLGGDFRVAKWSWPKGLALLGFYLEKTKGLAERPLICVNSAHHPAIAGATFDREIGHHLTSLIFDSRKEPVRFSLYMGSARHLDDPMELAADILVSFRVCPEDVARRIFGRRDGEREKRAGQRLAGADLAKALDNAAARYGLNFDANRSSDQMLQCLAGLFHYTKLRRALFEQYDL